jgi:hypothetical protein
MVRRTTVRAGDTLYDVHRTKLGNTTMSELGWWRVEIKSIDPSGNGVIASWNGNTPKWMSWTQIERLRRSIPKKLAHHGETKP